MIRIALNLVFFCAVCTSYGQESLDTTIIDTSTVIQVDQVEVIKAFEANLKNAERIKVSPKILKKNSVKKEYDYSISITPVEIDYPEPIIKPLAMKPDEPESVNKFYTKLGYGTLKNPYVSILYNDVVQDISEFGVSLEYWSKDDSDNTIHQIVDNANLSLSGKWYMNDNAVMDIALNGGFQKRGLYQTEANTLATYSREEGERDISQGGVRLGFVKLDIPVIRANLRTDVYYNYDKVTNDDANGSNVGLNLKLDKEISDDFEFLMSSSVSYDQISVDQSNDLFSTLLNGVFEYKTGKFKIGGGLNWYYDDFSSESKLWPEVDLLFTIVDGHVILKANSSMNYFTNNLRNLIRSNPYIVSNYENLTNSINSNFHAGITGQFSFLGYEVALGYSEIDNHVFYVNDEMDMRRFSLIYDDISIQYFKGSLDFAFTDNIGIGGVMFFNNYNTTDLSEIINLPKTKTKIFANIGLLNNTLSCRPSLIISDKSNYLREGEVLSLNALTELNVELEYKISNKLRLWAEGINLLDNEYQWLFGYPTFGINASGGVKLIF